MKKVERMIF